MIIYSGNTKLNSKWIRQVPRTAHAKFVFAESEYQMHVRLADLQERRNATGDTNSTRARDRERERRDCERRPPAYLFR
jgi:hypothetical protein